MARLPKIKRNSEFQTIFKTGRIWSDSAAVLYVSRQRVPGNRLGICVSKKMGNAVERNRIKRLLHESCRSLWAQVKPVGDFVLLARRGIVGLGYEDVRQRVHSLLVRARLVDTSMPSVQAGIAKRSTAPDTPVAELA